MATAFWIIIAVLALFLGIAVAMLVLAGYVITTPKL
jgi:hypothetical protein